MKLSSLLFASAIFLASCTAQHTCPTYMKKENKKTETSVKA